MTSYVTIESPEFLSKYSNGRMWENASTGAGNVTKTTVSQTVFIQTHISDFLQVRHVQEE